jgi:hypothetical protein
MPSACSRWGGQALGDEVHTQEQQGDEEGLCARGRGPRSGAEATNSAEEEQRQRLWLLRTAHAVRASVAEMEAALLPGTRSSGFRTSCGREKTGREGMVDRGLVDRREAMEKIF